MELSSSRQNDKLETGPPKLSDDIAHISTDINYNNFFQQIYRDLEIPITLPQSSILQSLVAEQSSASAQQILQWQQKCISYLHSTMQYNGKHIDDLNQMLLLNTNSFQNLDKSLLRQYIDLRNETNELNDRIQYASSQKQNLHGVRYSMFQGSLLRQFNTMHRDLRGLEFFPQPVPLLRNVPPRKSLRKQGEEHTLKFCLNGQTIFSALNFHALLELFYMLTEEEILNGMKIVKVDEDIPITTIPLTN